MSQGRPLAVSRAATVAVWLAAVAAAIVVAWRSHYVADLSAFLPAAPTPEQAVLLDQLKSGATSRLVLIGVEGAPPGSSGDAAAAARALASSRLAAALRASGEFASVNNGETAAWADAGRFVFEHRYQLSPAIDAARFTVKGLRDAIEETVSLLGTPAGSLLKPIVFRDPTGETLRIAEMLTPARAPKIEDGVWVSRSAARAVLVATTKANGADIDGQQRALAAVDAAFAAAATPGLAVVTSGAGRFAVESRARIKSEVERLAVLGSLIVVALLWLAFGSLRALAIALLPVATGVVAGIAAVSLGFGQVHGMTLGFGTTLIGEAVDYAIYYLIQARGGAGAADRWRRESWPTVRLGLLTSLIGFAALVFTGFAGLAQLGVFSIAGLAAAAATTRFVFPVLVPHGASGAGLRDRLARFMRAATARLPRWRPLVAALAAASVVALVASPSPWHGELSALSPVQPTDLARDAALRADVGAAEAGALVAAAAADEQGALTAAEAIDGRLDALVAEDAIAGYDSPARLLPPASTQQRRIAALPDATTLTARLEEATAEGPLPAARLAPFVADVAAARTQPPIDRASLAATPLATAVDALLLSGDATRPWRALVYLQVDDARPLDVGRVRAAIAGVAGARVIAVKAELDAIYARFLQAAEWQAALGAAAVTLLLAWQLRSARRLGAVAMPIATATLAVLAALTLAGRALGILHLVGLLLTVAIGSNYALFFDHLREKAEVDADTLASLLLANLTTVASFGLLASSPMPVLHAVGIVVAPGAFLCLVFSAAWLGRDDGGSRARGKIAA
ncbi:MAG TPA: MMPL family transporter [Caldimonas sp.]|nr:MMPL family transporter [Caldimonas sp.]HEX4234309.1 MMPL family transporter [Caldimonas sp.]